MEEVLMVRLSKNRFRVRDVEAEEWQQQTTARMVDRAVWCDQGGVSSVVWLVIVYVFEKGRTLELEGLFFQSLSGRQNVSQKGFFYYFYGEKQAKLRPTAQLKIDCTTCHSMVWQPILMSCERKHTIL